MMSRPRTRKERGQILVLFEVMLIVILGFAALVIDLGFLRNNRQTLVNAVDAGALAGGTMLPVTTAANVTAHPSYGYHNYQDAEALINETIQTDYPGLKASDYTITYKCLIGTDPSGNPAISRDIPTVCDPSKSLGRQPVTGDFQGAGTTRFTNCVPSKGDVCNVVFVQASKTTQFTIGPVIGVNQGSTGSVSSAACKGGCVTSAPADLVIVLDRTLSMSSSQISYLQAAAKTVLGVYNPAQQRVALALTGPSVVDANGNPTLATCTAASSGKAYGSVSTLYSNHSNNWTPLTHLVSSGTTTLVNASTTLSSATDTTFVSTTLGAAITSTTSTSITVSSSTGFPTPSTANPFYIQIDSEQMAVTGWTGTGNKTWTVQRGQNGTRAATHTNGTNVYFAMTAATTNTQLAVSSYTNFPTTNGYTVLVGSELMTVTAGAGTQVWTVTRAQGGTAAAAHGGNSNVYSPQIKVANASSFPSGSSILIDSEEMLVTGTSGNTLTVARAQDGTTAATHSNGSAVTLVFSSTTNTIKVASTANFPSSGNFTIQVDSEHMLVTGGQGTTTWTVTRAQDGTTAARHSGGATVTRVVGKQDTTILVDKPYNLGFASTPFTVAVGSEGHGTGYEHMTVIGTSPGPTTGTYWWSVTRGVDYTPTAAHSTGNAGTYTSGDTVYGYDGTAGSGDTTGWVDSGGNINASATGMWIPVGLTGTDFDQPTVPINESYSSGGNPTTTSKIVQAINCISSASDGTDLSTPIRMAQAYLDQHGRQGVPWGILLETDGYPQYGFAGDGDQTTTSFAYTCQAAINAATDAKNDKSNGLSTGIQVYTIGYGVSSSYKCPTHVDITSTTDTDASRDNGTYNRYESTGAGGWSGVPATTLLSSMATKPTSPYYFEDPQDSELASDFAQVARNLASGSHLIQLYPPPVVTSVSSGPSVTISGEYFTGATSVNFGNRSVSFTPHGDTSITATAPTGLGGPVPVTVTTPGGTSVITGASYYTP